MPSMPFNPLSSEFSNKSSHAYNDWPEKSTQNPLAGTTEYTESSPNTNNSAPASLDPTFTDLVHFPGLAEQELNFLTMCDLPMNGNFTALSDTGTLERYPYSMQAPLETKAPSPSLLCPWNGCKRPGPFSQKGTLDRHIQTQHVAPRAFKCPQTGCNWSFNRNDNLNQHRQSIHQHVIQKGTSLRIARLA